MSQEESLRTRRVQDPNRQPGPPSSPQRRAQRRPRRNSESSALDFDAQPLTEEEKRMIEAKRQRDRQRRERENREIRENREGREKKESREDRENREGKERREGREGKEQGDRTKSNRPNRRMDIIDQLDATSIYGTGCMFLCHPQTCNSNLRGGTFSNNFYLIVFHHDGPFDALNPNRNKGTSRRAPMQAFPKDSLNNTIGGSGPLNRQPNHATFMGHAMDEAFTDYAAGAKIKNGYSYPQQEAIFDPIARGSIVHGDESRGLGTTTFLEGTPAAKIAIDKHQQEQSQVATEAGLQRKKSLAQRIRHINKGPRRYDAAGRMLSPDGAPDPRSPDAMPSGGISTASDSPFFSEYGKGEDVLSVKPQDSAQTANSPPPLLGPRRGSHNPLERRATTDATMSTEEAPAKPSGLLGRMKSLKGGSRKGRGADGSGGSGSGHQANKSGTAI